jgi:glycopeptide antibiotics resistance protein
MRSGSNRKLLLALALGYTAFVIYGSLVPLNFQPHPLHEAFQRFQRISYLELGVASRADWVANILLFVPLSFLWLGTLWPSYGRSARALASVVVLIGCTSLSLAVEFAQIFFPPRTVSLNDIVAESLGATFGIVLWWSAGRRVRGWLSGWSSLHTQASTAGRLLHGYLFLVLGYNLLPLDLTISIVEIYHKWQQGKILIVPFSVIYETRAHAAYALLAGIAIWIPAAFLWQLSSSRPARTIVLYVVVCAAAIEFLQLFVYSRVTSTTDILNAGVGAMLGVVLAKRVRSNADDHTAKGTRGFAVGARAALLWFLLFAAWIAVLMAVFWYPFDFSTDWGLVQKKLALLKRVPLQAYYYGTELRAATEVIHKTAFFFPLGALLGVAAVSLHRRRRVPAVMLHATSALLVAGAAAGIEGGQLFLPAKNADPTDWVLETLGGMAGYFCLWKLTPLWRSEGRGHTPR